MTLTETDKVPSPTPLVSSADRPAWLEARRQGITATDIGKLMKGGAGARDVITIKLTGVDNFTGNKYTERGNEREPVIAAWILENFDLHPSSILYAGADPRHLATPDGVSESFREDGLTSEIKTSGKDLDPGCGNRGTLDLAKLDQAWQDASYFWASTDYYSQVQWQMYVMHGERVLFAWEQHDGNWDQPGGPKPLHPQPFWCWVLRDDAYIEKMVEVANKTLATIDQLRADGLPPLGAIEGEAAQHVHNLLQHRDLEAITKAQKENEWAWLQDYVEGRPAFQVENEEASITWDPEKVGAAKPQTTVDEPAMRRKAPALMKRYDELREKYTTTEMVQPDPKPQLTVTRKKTSK